MYVTDYMATCRGLILLLIVIVVWSSLYRNELVTFVVFFLKYVLNVVPICWMKFILVWLWTLKVSIYGCWQPLNTYTVNLRQLWFDLGFSEVCVMPWSMIWRDYWILQRIASYLVCVESAPYEYSQSSFNNLARFIYISAKNLLLQRLLNLLVVSFNSVNHCKLTLVQIKKDGITIWDQTWCTSITNKRSVTTCNQWLMLQLGPDFLGEEFHKIKEFGYIFIDFFVCY